MPDLFVVVVNSFSNIFLKRLLGLTTLTKLSFIDKDAHIYGTHNCNSISREYTKKILGSQRGNEVNIEHAMGKKKEKSYPTLLFVQQKRNCDEYKNE